MKLFIKRDISDIDSGFTVFDELGNEKYFAVFTKTKSAFRISVIDTNKNVAVKIRKVPLMGANTFVIKAGKSHITFVVIISSKEIFCNFYGNNWHVIGDVPAKNFKLIDVDNSLISSQKKCADVINLEVVNPSDELYCVAASICVELINTIDKLAVQAV